MEPVTIALAAAAALKAIGGFASKAKQAQEQKRKNALDAWTGRQTGAVNNPSWLELAGNTGAGVGQAFFAGQHGKDIVGSGGKLSKGGDSPLGVDYDFSKSNSFAPVDNKWMTYDQMFNQPQRQGAVGGGLDAKLLEQELMARKNRGIGDWSF